MKAVPALRFATSEALGNVGSSDILNRRPGVPRSRECGAHATGSFATIRRPAVFKSGSLTAQPRRPPMRGQQALPFAARYRDRRSVASISEVRR